MTKHSFIPQNSSFAGPLGTTLYLIRHGEVSNAKEISLNGHFDVGLSPFGVQQFETLTRVFGQKKIHAIYSSDLNRAWRGAQMLAEEHEIVPKAFRDFRELSFGQWEGMRLKELQTLHPEAMQERLKNTMAFRAPGGESFQELHDRVIPKFEDIVKRHPDENLILVCHGGVIRTLLCHLLDVPLKNIFRFSQEYAAVNVIRFYEKHPIVELVNGNHRHVELSENE